jgi:hypothetical protein
VPPPVSDRSPSRRGWVLALGFASTAIVLQYLLVLAYRHQAVWWKTWEHTVHVRWSWLQFIHPPLFNEYMAAMQRLSADRSWPIDDLVNQLNALLAFPLVLLILATTRERARGRWLGLVGVLALLSPSAYRPFEQYPVSTLVLTGALALSILWFRRGGRVLGLTAFAALLGAVEFHLSSWFVVAPLLVAGAAMLPDRRRGIAWGGLLLLALFFVSTQPGIFTNSLMDVLEQDNVRNHSLFSLKDFSMLTFELSNPFLYLPLALWALPRVRAQERRGLPVALALVGYVAAHLFLQGYGLALASKADEPHHYFQMVDPIVAAITVWALAATADAYPERLRAVQMAGVALVATQALYLGKTLLTVYARGH